MNLKPLGDRVIVKQDEAEETTASGLFLATEAKEKPQSGTVLAVVTTSTLCLHKRRRLIQRW